MGRTYPVGRGPPSIRISDGTGNVASEIWMDEGRFAGPVVGRGRREKKLHSQILPVRAVNGRELKDQCSDKYGKYIYVMGLVGKKKRVP